VRKSLLLVFALAFLMVASLQAATLTIEDTATYALIPGANQTNQVLGWLNGPSDIGGYLGANLSVDGPANVLVEFIGYEDGNHVTNTFTFDGTTFDTAIGGKGFYESVTGVNLITDAPIFTTLAAGGLLDFEFDTTAADPVANGDNDGHPLGSNFFISCTYSSIRNW